MKYNSYFCTKLNEKTMKKLLFTMFMLVPMTLWAQDNTWEKPEVDEQEEVAKVKGSYTAEYLRRVLAKK